MSVSRTRDVRMRIGPALLASYTSSSLAVLHDAAHGAQVGLQHAVLRRALAAEHISAATAMMLAPERREPAPARGAGSRDAVGQPVVPRRRPQAVPPSAAAAAASLLRKRRGGRGPERRQRHAGSSGSSLRSIRRRSRKRHERYTVSIFRVSIFRVSVNCVYCAFAPVACACTILLYPSPIPVRTLQYRSMTDIELFFKSNFPGGYSRGYWWNPKRNTSYV